MPEISVAPETLFSIGPLDVTNSLLGTWLAIALLIVYASGSFAGAEVRHWRARASAH